MDTLEAAAPSLSEFITRSEVLSMGIPGLYESNFDRVMQVNGIRRMEILGIRPRYNKHDLKAMLADSIKRGARSKASKAVHSL